MSDRDDALADLDAARADIAAVGLYRYALTVRVRAWGGRRPQEGVATLADTPILPRPRTRVLTLREVAASGGTYRDGDYFVTGITPPFAVQQIATRQVAGPSPYGTGGVVPSAEIPATGVRDAVSPVEVRCLTPGAAAVATFEYSLDAGATWTAAGAAAPSFDVPAVGLRVTPTGSFAAGDTYTFLWASGGFTPAQVRPTFAAGSGSDVRYVLAGDEGTLLCTLIECDFDRAFGLRLVLRQTSV